MTAEPQVVRTEAGVANSPNRVAIAHSCGTKDSRARLAIINMPFAATSRPSIQCGLLKAILNRAGYEADVFYFNLRLAAALGPELYSKLADNQWLSFLGDWLFAAAAFGPREDELLYLQTSGAAGHRAFVGLKDEELLELRNRVLPGLLDAWIEETDWNQYSAVGFSCTFDQNTASFALARKLKARFPDLITVFGGANFDDESAVEYVSKLEWIDYVVVGEGDRALPSLVEQLARGESGVGISGVVGRSNGKVSGTRAEMFSDLDSLPDPDYDHYFSTLSSLGQPSVLGSASPQLPFQAARGCWWGQKHHCAFCGLNGSAIAFRSRNPRLVYQELQRQSARYRTLKFIATDNILDMKYIDTLFSWMRDSRHDYALFYETKANLTRPQVHTLVQGGAKAIQAGIESLNTHVLQLMNKGTTTLLNLRLLKWARYYGLHVAWNLLTGFPGESLEDYQAQAKLIPLIFHLEPPTIADSIMLEKYGPYLISRDPFYQNVRPARGYSFIFQQSINIDKIALYFDAEQMADDWRREALEELKRGVERWNELWRADKRPALMCQRSADWMRVEDRRDPQNPKTHWLTAQFAAVYDLCSETAQSVGAIVRHFRQSGGGCTVEADIRKMLDQITEAGLMVEDRGYYLSLALPVNPGW
jgi:ribosomal peptide maturation radical SAM protein 1